MSIDALAFADRKYLQDVVSAIRNSTRILIACHVNPDGDALGSMIGLGTALRGLDKNVTLVSVDGVPANLAFLPESQTIVKKADGLEFDLAIVVDAGDLARVGGIRSAIEASPLIIDIDHHVTAGAFGALRLIDATAAATAEIVFDLLGALGVVITLPIAECLLCGLLTDTGSFRFMNVTKRTMTIAGYLVDIGASPDRIAENVFENKSFASQKLLGRALDSLGLSADGRVAWARISADDLAEFSGREEDTEGVVNAVRSVRGVDVALFLRETPSGQIRVSLRARPPVDVSAIAAKFGGGGHRLASGCTLDGPMEPAETLLVETVIREMALQSA